MQYWKHMDGKDKEPNISQDPEVKNPYITQYSKLRKKTTKYIRLFISKYLLILAPILFLVMFLYTIYIEFSFNENNRSCGGGWNNSDCPFGYNCHYDLDRSENFDVGGRCVIDPLYTARNIINSVIGIPGGIIYDLKIGNNVSTQNVQIRLKPSVPPPIIIPTKADVKISLVEAKSIDTLNPSALIKIPFVRDRSIYLYEDGEEKLVAKPTEKTTEQNCFNLVFPFLSPNGKYLAYIEQIGDEPHQGGCWEGMLRIVDISTGINKPTNYKTTYLRWTSSNLLNFVPVKEVSQIPERYTLKHIYFDPISQKEEKVFKVIIDQDERFTQILFSADYPSNNLNKLIRFKNNRYYLIDNNTNKETFLFEKNQIKNFSGWSPEERYAVFESVKNPEPFYRTELIVDTQNPSAAPREIIVYTGASGGDVSAGHKWYFEKGYFVYCDRHIYFLDGSQPLRLTSDGGGGCHNEEGFVATSPNGEYAFVKFNDVFELHTKDGHKTIINETIPLKKSRHEPKNLIWLNNDYMAIFESTNNYYSSSWKPKIYLFDRKSNIIKPLIENAYLRNP